jgi:chorismate synthase
MPGNTFGELFRVTTAGVSHGPGYLCIIDGCPPGLPLGQGDLLPDLRRRRPGQSKIVTQRQEEDVPEIWSGVFEGRTEDADRHPLPQPGPAQPGLRRY